METNIKEVLNQGSCIYLECKRNECGSFDFLCKLKKESDHKVFDDIKNAYEKDFPDKNYLPNNECQFAYLNAVEKCPFSNH